jgi:hypothetical protein
VLACYDTSIHCNRPPYMRRTLYLGTYRPLCFRVRKTLKDGNIIGAAPTLPLHDDHPQLHLNVRNQPVLDGIGGSLGAGSDTELA